jgi:hypothetical protein
MPLTNLWDEKGHLNAYRVRRVGRNEISQLLRNGSTFVVADVGHPLHWMPEQYRFSFWKAEVRDHLVPVELDRFYLEDYPNEYCYIASEWHWPGAKPIVVLEKYH